jgi:hypothetical protein
MCPFLFNTAGNTPPVVIPRATGKKQTPVNYTTGSKHRLSKTTGLISSIPAHIENKFSQQFKQQELKQ